MVRPNGIAGILAVFGLVVVGSSAQAEYPEEPITLIIQYPTGGTVDLGARMIGPYWEEYLGTSLTILNRPGASGQIALTEVSRSEPDGYTIGAWSSPPQNVVITMGEDVQFNLDSFDWIGNQQADPNLLVVAANSDIENFEDFVNSAGGQNGSIRVSQPGRFGGEEVLARTMSDWLDIELTTVPFDGSPEALAALLGGHVEAMLENTVSLRPGIEDGELRPIVVFWHDRLDFAPDTPTFAEVVDRPLTMASYRGFLAPAGIPEDRLEHLRDSFREAMQDPRFIEEAEGRIPLEYLGGDEYREEVGKIQDLVDEMLSGVEE